MTRHLRSAVAAVAVLAFAGFARGSEYQWSTTVDAVTSPETGRPPRAFLWVPPDCQRVRGVVVGQHNMQEEPILEHPRFRATLAELGFAAVWITPGIDLQFKADALPAFDQMMSSLATTSGYAELATAPVVPIGHSAAASFPFNFAALRPGRTLAAISVSGQFPYGMNPPDRPAWADTRNVDGVPMLTAMGEYEWAYENVVKGMKQRAEHPQIPMSFLGVPADGHFAAIDEKVDFLCLYLRKAAEHRLGDEAGSLKPIDPTKVGWLADRYHKDAPPRAPAAPVGAYTGDPAEAFWYFDGELARAAESFGAEQRGKRPQLVGYVQNGAIVPQRNGTHQQVTLQWLPYGDGLTFRLSGGFLDAVPDGRPVKWTGLKHDALISNPGTDDRITIARITGPVEQIAPDTWALRFNRVGFDNPKRSNDAWFVAIHPGDATYKRAVQQAQLRMPLKNTAGAEQSIDFPALPDVPTASGTIPLHATSSAGETVRFYVREGPAEIDGDATLRFTAIPPRAAYPVSVTVVAWQWGRSIEPRLKSAEPVERTFQILGPGGTIAPAPAARQFPTTAASPPATRPFVEPPR